MEVDVLLGCMIGVGLGLGRILFTIGASKKTEYRCGYPGWPPLKTTLYSKGDVNIGSSPMHMKQLILGGSLKNPVKVLCLCNGIALASPNPL